MSSESASSQRAPSLARGGSLNIFGAICQQGSQLGIVFLLARFLGGASLGTYILAWAVLTLSGIMSCFGFRAALTRYVAIQLADGNSSGVLVVVRHSLRAGLIAAVAIGVVLFVFADPMARMLNQPDLAGGLQVAALALPALTLRELCLAATQGWRTQRPFAIIGWIYEPLTRLALTALALAVGFGLRGAFLALLFSTWSSAVAAAWALRRRLRLLTLQEDAVRIDTRPLWQFATVSWASTLASSGLIWADTLILGYFENASDVGTYTIAARLVSLAVFVMAPINAVFAPQFAHLFHLGDLRRLGAAFTMSTTWIVRLSLPAFVVLMVFPSNLLALFGPGYAAGATVTMLLACGQLVNAASGPCGTLLNMCGRVGLNLVSNIGVLTLNITLNIILIPRYGIVGAAFAWTLSLALVNVLRLVWVRRIIGIFPVSSVTAKAVASGSVSAVAALALRHFVGASPAETVFVVAATFATYIVASGLFGLDAAERRAVSTMFAKLRKAQ